MTLKLPTQFVVRHNEYLSILALAYYASKVCVSFDAFCNYWTERFLTMGVLGQSDAFLMSVCLPNSSIGIDGNISIREHNHSLRETLNLPRGRLIGSVEFSYAVGSRGQLVFPCRYVYAEGFVDLQSNIVSYYRNPASPTGIRSYARLPG